MSVKRRERSIEPRKTPILNRIVDVWVQNDLLDSLLYLDKFTTDRFRVVEIFNVKLNVSYKYSIASVIRFFFLSCKNKTKQDERKWRRE